MHNEGLGCGACRLVFHRGCLAEQREKTYRETARPRARAPRCPQCRERLVSEPIEVHVPDSTGPCQRCGIAHPENELCFRLAPLGHRLWAQVIDGLIAVGLFALTMPLWEMHDALVWVGLVLFLGYHLFADALPGGQSIGKRWARTAVVDDQTGRPCTVACSAVRNITQLFGVFDWIWILGARRQRAGDSLAGTRVILARR